MLPGARPLLLVGAGKMGGAMLDRWLGRGFDPALVTVLDPFLDAERLKSLSEAGVEIATQASALAARALGFVVLAVKPQSMAEALAAVAPLAASDAVVVSIAAGVRFVKLEAAFPAAQPIIRAMPNTPAQVGMGITVAVANANVTEAQRNAVDALLSAVGRVAWIGDEGLIDAVTAVSGSGPAYVFLLAECLAEAAREAGLPDDLAGLLARQTVAGAGALLAESPLSPAKLRLNVTSPGGTTAAALEVLMAADGLKPLLIRAVERAKKRSIELG
ncbi:MAG: pyrroline-5-carboxylate reductase [Propylenella sp.]